MTEGQSKDYSLSNILREVYLNNFHKDNKAKFVPFAGYSMPVNYDKGIIKEHLHVRKSCGIFDVSHMGQILVLNSDSNIVNLEKYVPLNLKKLKDNKSYYSFLLNSNGGIIDDVIISKIKYQNNHYFFIVYNSSRKEINEKIFKNILTDYIFLVNNCLIAVQGPLSEKILDFFPETKNLFFMNIITIEYKESSIILSRSGYTGEDGFEISIPNFLAIDFIKKMTNNSNAVLCGLGSRDSLRLEAGLSLYGNELNETITPIDANLIWAINKDRISDNKLNGQKILLSQLNKGTNNYKIGIKTSFKSILRNNMKLYDAENNEIGKITSGSYSPMLQTSIAIGYINKKLDLGKNIYVSIRNKIEELEIVTLPFVMHKYKKG